MQIIKNDELDEVIEKVKEKLTQKYKFLERSMKLLKKHELGKIKSDTVIQLTNNPEFIVDYMMMQAEIKDSSLEPKETPEKLEGYLTRLGYVLENMT